jgi:hypothetical protein
MVPGQPRQKVCKTPSQCSQMWGWGSGGGKVAQIMYIHTSKFKSNKIKRKEKS